MTITDTSSTLSVRNPASDAVLAEVPRASVEDARDAVEYAQRGRREMASLAAHERADLLFEIAER